MQQQYAHSADALPAIAGYEVLSFFLFLINSNLKVRYMRIQTLLLFRDHLDRLLFFAMIRVRQIKRHTA
ncbi:hypothetical protein BBG47_03125 [Paenibacillus sp. KS1]|nr:hypothetical protein BBG47_03125 [Paenibacillus sp. KS1]